MDGSNTSDSIRSMDVIGPAAKTGIQFRSSVVDPSFPNVPQRPVVFSTARKSSEHSVSVRIRSRNYHNRSIVLFVCAFLLERVVRNVIRTVFRFYRMIVVSSWSLLKRWKGPFERLLCHTNPYPTTQSTLTKYSRWMFSLFRSNDTPTTLYVGKH